MGGLPAEGVDSVMHVEDNSYAMIHAAPRVHAPLLLDITCGSGVQGIVALFEYADYAIFNDLNPRALRFTRFNLYFNGLFHRAKGLYHGDVYKALPPDLK